MLAWKLMCFQFQSRTECLCWFFNSSQYWAGKMFPCKLWALKISSFTFLFYFFFVRILFYIGRRNWDEAIHMRLSCYQSFPLLFDIPEFFYIIVYRINLFDVGNFHNNKRWCWLLLLLVLRLQTQFDRNKIESSQIWFCLY